MRHVLGILALGLALTGPAGCARKIPRVDLSRVDSTFLERCKKTCGVLVFEDQRYSDYWGGGYDTTEWLLIGGSGNVTSAVTSKMTVRRMLMKILSEKGAKRASEFSVIHYREKIPPNEVHVWMEDGTPRMVRVSQVSTTPVADWPCELSYPRRTTFRISTLMPGDKVEITYPLSGPEQMRWTFGSSKFCVLHSKASFGHEDDDYRPDMNAILIDASGGVSKTSPGEEYPMTFELKKPLMPISRGRLPYVLLSPRCPGWKHLRGQILRTALWMARAGEVAGRGKVHPVLVKPVENGEKKRRIQALGDWLERRVQVEKTRPPFWMRWMPLEPVHQTAARRRGSQGSVAVLAFRVAEDAGLQPRLALLHTHARRPFRTDQPTAAQFDSLAVLVDDETGKTHWLVPGLPYSPVDQPPAVLAGHKALVLKRWWADREQGAGKCQPEMEVLFACQITTPEPVELELITIGG